jgi:hypothetical protein
VNQPVRPIMSGQERHRKTGRGRRTRRHPDVLPFSSTRRRHLPTGPPTCSAVHRFDQSDRFDEGRPVWRRRRRRVVKTSGSRRLAQDIRTQA